MKRKQNIFFWLRLCCFGREFWRLRLTRYLFQRKMKKCRRESSNLLGNHCRTIKKMFCFHSIIALYVFQLSIVQIYRVETNLYYPNAPLCRIISTFTWNNSKTNTKTGDLIWKYRFPIGLYIYFCLLCTKLNLSL